jgi:dTDP-4-amino-4,6-dideoxygalactose transaminase
MDRKVNFFNYPLQFKINEKKYMEIINETLSKGAFILSEDLINFEEDFARFVGSRYAVGVSNCTDAILLALLASGVGSGDEVISVSHTFVATIEVLEILGAKPVLIDIADDHNMNVELLESAITPKTKAIVPVHLNGRICNQMDKLIDIAKEHNLIVIEDAAQSLGATYKGKDAGTFGLAGCFSFYPAKLLGAFGDAGAVVTDDAELAERIRLLRNHGREGTDIKCWGFNCRMDNLHAAILNYKLNLLPQCLERRREIAGMYHDELSVIKKIKLPPPPGEEREHYDVFQNYEIEAENRDALVKYLNKKGIQVMLPWGGKGVHQFKSLGLDFFRLPRTEELFRKALMLPLYPELTNKEVGMVVDEIKSFYC